MLYLNYLGFAAGKADDVIPPVNIFGVKIGDVGLRTAEVPAQLIIGAPLIEPFIFQYREMFFVRDGPLREASPANGRHPKAWRRTGSAP